jgi:hypothetical protein
VKGRRTYVDYFAGTPLQWFPEWELDLGAPAAAARTIDDLAGAGVYRREFAKGIVLVNPTGAAVTVALSKPMRRAEMVGGGDVPADGKHLQDLDRPKNRPTVPLRASSSPRENGCDVYGLRKFVYRHIFHAPREAVNGPVRARAPVDMK